MASTPIIQLAGITKTYQTGEVVVRALVSVDLTVQTGEIVAIMGPSGSGKSTLMNVLGCLDRPTSGSYLFEGREVATLPKRELSALRLSALGFVFQGFQLIARTSALDNVALPLVYADVPVAERRARAAEALARVGLEGREDHTPAQLSGGQQQRVAIARALVNRPRLILADEPTGALDTRTSVEILGLFQSLHAAGITIVIVTHEPDIAAYAGRRIVVRDGRILTDDAQEPHDAAADLAALPPPEITPEAVAAKAAAPGALRLPGVAPAARPQVAS
jgi:putative ABC transport system ATP-binding protein